MTAEDRADTIKYLKQVLNLRRFAKKAGGDVDATNVRAATKKVGDLIKLLESGSNDESLLLKYLDDIKYLSKTNFQEN